MKKLFKILVIVACSFSLQSCEKDCEKNMKPENKDFYYVQFKAQSKYYMLGTARVGEHRVRFTDVTSFETILGPVKYGESASISGSTEGNYYIHVSKNNGPFALKASGTTGASYTIDF